MGPGNNILLNKDMITNAKKQHRHDEMILYSNELLKPISPSADPASPGGQSWQCLHSVPFKHPVGFQNHAQGRHSPQSGHNRSQVHQNL